MKILHVNKFHHIKGGADAVYFNTAKLLKSHGHEALFFAMHHPDNLPCHYDKYFAPFVDFNKKCTLKEKIKIGARILYNIRARKCLAALLKNNHVDIAHLHNIYHQISPSILHELKKLSIPVVMTLHDLKMVCASYLMFSAGRPCNECRGRQYFKAIQNRCIKGSISKSILGTLEMTLHHKILNIYRHADVLIAPSIFMKHQLAVMGFQREVIYLPNYFDAAKFDEMGLPNKRHCDRQRQCFAYVGRLSHEKGLHTLLSAAKIISKTIQNIEFWIIGGGPMDEELRSRCEKEKMNFVKFYGHINQKRVYEKVSQCIALILPSECYENSPLAVLEAFALSRPVIGSDLGGIPELIKEERGITFEAGNAIDLSKKIEFLAGSPDQSDAMGRNARDFLERELNGERHYKKLMDIYRQAMSLSTH